MKNNLIYVVFNVVFILLVSMISFVYAASPNLTITEIYRQDYLRNGTSTGTNVNQGYVAIRMVNVADVLQYARLNVSSTGLSRTNIANRTDTDGRTWNFYGGAVSDNASLYHNASGSDSSTYTINADGPRLNISMAVRNYAGGSDVYNDDNIFDNNYESNLNQSWNNLNITINITNPSGWKSLNAVNVTITFNQNTGGSYDVVNVTGVTIFNGTTLISFRGNQTEAVRNASGGMDSELVNWTGDIVAYGNITITINATTMTNRNFLDFVTSNNLNDAAGTTGVVGVFNSSAVSGLDNTKLLTGMNVTVKFSRGPVRQGIDMALTNPSNGSSPTWRIRGFFKNAASENGGGLDYLMSAWKLYQVLANGTPVGTANSSSTTPGWGTIAAGTTKYTDWFDTQSAVKPYFASYFDWNVSWAGSEGYVAEVRGRLDMGSLYVIDVSNAKAIDGVMLPSSGTDMGLPEQSIKIRDSITYLGDNNARGINFSIYSVYPPKSVNGTVVVFYANCSSAAVTVNGTAITSNVTITCVNNTASAEGYVKAVIKDLNQSLFNSYLMTNNVVNISYDLVFNESLQGGLIFNMTGNATVWSQSGTPIMENLPLTNITVSTKRLSAYKELKINNPAQPNTVNATIRVDAYDKSEAADGIADIKLLDYIVNGTNFSINSVLIVYYNKSGDNSVTLVNGTNMNITHLSGATTLTDGTPVDAYEYSRLNASNLFWNGTMKDEDYLVISYIFNITATGTYTLPMQVFGLDPATGAAISSSAFGSIYVAIPEPAKPFEIEDSNLTLAKIVVVGQPATWSKKFAVYNPNGRPIRSRFETNVFDDSTQAYAGYYDSFGQRIDEKVEKDNGLVFWETTMGALETRTYDITVLTPPILEIDRKVEVLEKLENKKVKLKTDIYLKNFAKEAYENIRLNLPISYDKIVEVRDLFGERLMFNGGADSISITIGEMEAEGVKTITVIYEEGYPAVIVTSDKDRYTADSPVGLAILVINGGERIDHPYFETEILDPRLDTVHSSFIDLNSLDPLEKTETTEKFAIPMEAITGSYVANVRFREDFTTISEGFANFYVLGKREGILMFIETAIIVMLGLVLLVLTYRRIQEIRKDNWT